MARFAAKIDSRLLAELERLYDEHDSMGALWRRVGAAADALRLTRPSYAAVRLYALEERRRRETERKVRERLVDAALRLNAGRPVDVYVLAAEIAELRDRS